MASAASYMKQLLNIQKATNKETFDFNKEEANTARKWETEMSNTAHQREVADLQAAGLNPVLSSNSGAQSYTTAAASAHADSAVNAIANVYGSEQSAAATRYAAQQQAAATRAAAAANIRAASIAADAQKYHSDRAYDASVYKSKMDYKTAMEKPQSNPFALADKYLGSAVSKGAKTALTNIAKSFKVEDFSNKKNVTADNFVLDKQGMLKADKGLSQLGIERSNEHRRLYVKAFVFGDKQAAQRLGMIAADRKHTREKAKKRWS